MAMKPAHALFLFSAVMGAAQAQMIGRDPDFQAGKIIQTVAPEFPFTLYQVYNHGGTAQLVINIDAEGKLKDWLIVGYTAPKFADLALTAVKQWRFEPARWRGDAVPSCTTLTFTFAVKGVVISVVGNENLPSYFSTLFDPGNSRRLYSLRELDHIPIPIHADAPLYPKSLADQGVAGEVVVGFYIDEQGAVRLPFVISWRQNSVANLAIDAVQRWKFEPPTHAGRPVMAYVQQVFEFGPSAGH